MMRRARGLGYILVIGHFNESWVHSGSSLADPESGTSTMSTSLTRTEHLMGFADDRFNRVHLIAA
jgi:hypothetical protein